LFATLTIFLFVAVAPPLLVPARQTKRICSKKWITFDIEISVEPAVKPDRV
jgi:hypothetical protein